ncbi:helix-turn-helix domain-containing protein [Leeia sp. TBRC 13508]|uniref:Helix-turn-helix domain-containing protein n=1 Tax=Leeia speluncae TaxID=2884804 RepID=A0ABS8D435_9NEIS|nr:helix-turn-helix domain-containing protein [Leeia speluncae]MCB6182971.1 helix-turn-helix domain-containing protein [Leeia speluncae]
MQNRTYLNLSFYIADGALLQTDHPIHSAPFHSKVRPVTDEQMQGDGFALCQSYINKDGTLTRYFRQGDELMFFEVVEPGGEMLSVLLECEATLPHALQTIQHFEWAWSITDARIEQIMHAYHGDQSPRKKPNVTGQQADVLEAIRKAKGGILSLELTANQSIPQACARVCELRDMGFQIRTNLQSSVIFRGKVRHHVALYTLDSPEWLQPMPKEAA